jgi:hypothetical protein
VDDELDNDHYSFTLIKNFAIAEKIKMQLLAEAFNLTNTPVFDQPGTWFGNANFGTITYCYCVTKIP